MKEITSVHNAAVQLLRELQKPRARRENGLFVCESAKLVGEAVTLRLAQALFIEKGREAEYAPMIGQAESAGCELYVVSTAVMQAVSTAKTPQGVVCTARIPQPPKALAGRRLVALDGVQDPGNVGTILRTADAAGFDGAILGPGCADLYGAKTLRATMGKAILVIGSEGQGISKPVRDAATHHLALPMRGGAESLNAAVAAGIMIYEMAREQA